MALLGDTVGPWRPGSSEAAAVVEQTQALVRAHVAEHVRAMVADGWDPGDAVSAVCGWWLDVLGGAVCGGAVDGLH